MFNGDVKLADTIYENFYTFDSAGDATDADSLPTVVVYEDGTSIAAAGATITDIGVGEYKCDIVCSTGNGYEVGKRYNVTVVTVIGGKTRKGSLGSFYVVARDRDDLTYPTVSGRSTDVSAGGEVGIDWANIGSPTTSVNLSGTIIKTATDVETDTADIQTRLPAALVSGRIDASVGAMAANVITAAATAADFVTEQVNAFLAGDVEGGQTVQAYLRYMAAVLIGMAEEMDSGTTVFYSPADSTQDRVTATQDGNNRAAPTLDNTDP